VQHHGAALRAIVEREGEPRPRGEVGNGEADDPERDLATALARDWRSAGLPQRLRAILAYAEKLTLEPGAVRAADLEPMREAGLDDEAILHVVEVVSYFNFVNRMADGLGVRLERSWSEPLVPIPSPGRSRGVSDEDP